MHCSALMLIGYELIGEAGRPNYERYHWGGLAEFVKVPAANLLRMPDNVSFEVACKLGTMAGAYRALKRARPRPGEVLAVGSASGATGTAAVAFAPLFGFARVVGVATRRSGLERVQRLLPHLDEVIATEELADGWEDGEALTEAVRAATTGTGPDVVADFTPFGHGIPVQLIRSMAAGGRALLVGGNLAELGVTYLELMRNGWQVIGSDGSNAADSAELLALLEGGRLDLEPLVTHRFRLEQVNEAVATVMGRTGDPILVVVNP
jgi:threonine dehydrogenase-like Zn-dependent dehydrogenase